MRTDATNQNSKPLPGKQTRKHSLPPASPRRRLANLARRHGIQLGSIGDFELLAGINTQSESERRTLWFKFKKLFNGPSQLLIDAVMDHCATIALRRISAGQISLINSRRCRERNISCNCD